MVEQQRRQRHIAQSQQGVDMIARQGADHKVRLTLTGREPGVNHGLWTVIELEKNQFRALLQWLLRPGREQAVAQGSAGARQRAVRSGQKHGDPPWRRLNLAPGLEPEQGLGGLVAEVGVALLPILQGGRQQLIIEQIAARSHGQIEPGPQRGLAAMLRVQTFQRGQGVVDQQRQSQLGVKITLRKAGLETLKRLPCRMIFQRPQHRFQT